jgi:WD40 repeat protein
MVAFPEWEDAVKARSYLLHLGIVLLLIAPLVLNGCGRPAERVPKHGTARGWQDGQQEVEPELALPSDELPKGAKLRLGTLGGAPPTRFLSFTQEGNGFLLGHLRGGIPHIWDLTTGKASHLPRIERPTEGNPGVLEGVLIALSANGKRGVLGQHGTYAVWELATGKVIARIKPPVSIGLHSDGFEASLSADGTILAFADRCHGPGEIRETEVLVWDVDKNEQLARVTPIQRGHVFPVISPDGKRLATFGYHPPECPRRADEPEPGETLQLWEVPGGKQLGTLPKVFGNNLLSVKARFSPDGKMLATDNNGSIRLWDVVTCKPKDPQPQLSGQAMTFSPDGKTLATLSQCVVHRWSIADGRPLSDTPIPNNLATAYPKMLNVCALHFTDNERVIVLGALGLRAAVAWEAPSGKVLTPIPEHYAEIRWVQFTADGSEVITNGEDDRIVSWDATTGKPIGSIPPPPGFIPRPRFISPSGTRAIIRETLTDLTTGKKLLILPTWPMGVTSDFNLVAGYNWLREKEGPRAVYEIFNLNTQRQVAVLDLPSKEVELNTPPGGCAMAFSPDGSRLVTAIRRKLNEALVAPLLVTGWDVKTGKKLGEFSEQSGWGEVHLAVPNNTSCVIVTEGATEIPKLWTIDYENGRKGEVIDKSPHRQHNLSAPVFSPDGKRFAWPVQANWNTGFGVRVYDWPSGRVVHTFEGHKAPVNVIAFSPDGKTLASGSQDTTVLLWDLTTLPAPK